jgi:hypothetical protein
MLVDVFLVKCNLIDLGMFLSHLFIHQKHLLFFFCEFVHGYIYLFIAMNLTVLILTTLHLTWKLVVSMKDLILEHFVISGICIVALIMYYRYRQKLKRTPSQQEFTQILSRVKILSRRAGLPSGLCEIVTMYAYETSLMWDASLLWTRSNTKWDRYMDSTTVFLPSRPIKQQLHRKRS